MRQNPQTKLLRARKSRTENQVCCATRVCQEAISGFGHDVLCYGLTVIGSSFDSLLHAAGVLICFSEALNAPECHVKAVVGPLGIFEKSHLTL